MSDRHALVAAIREAPRDDAPRLIFADWLDEHGEPDLAEFIRLQIEIEPFRRLEGDLDRWRRALIDLHLDDQVPPDFPPEWRRYVELGRRERDLLKARRWEWLGQLGAMDEDYSSLFSVTFRRGFAEEVAVATSAFLGGAEIVRGSCPMLRRLTLYGPRDQVAELVGTPELNGIPELDLAGWITAYDARFLTSSFALQSVESLTLWIGSREDPEVIRTLARRPWDGGPRGRSSPLPAGPHLPGLREFVLVQLNGGMLANDPHGQLDRRADNLAGEFNRIFGRAVARVERPWGRRFPLAGTVGGSVMAGHLCEQPILFRGGRFPYFIQVGDNGMPNREDPLHLPDEFRRPSHTVDQRELIRVLRREYGFLPGLVFVREFDSEEAALRVHLWGVHEDVIEDPDTRTDADEHEESCAAIDRYWMKSGNFVLESDDSYSVGPDGIVHES